MHRKNRDAMSFLVRMVTVAWVFSGFTVLNAFAESITVKIPVSCTGTDCTVVLCDMENRELDRLFLETGGEVSFEVLCDGPGDHSYIVKVDDRDTGRQAFDRTIYRVTVTICRGDQEELRYAITADPLSTADGEIDGKADALIFTNRVLPPSSDTGKIPLKDAWKKVSSGVSGAQTADRESCRSGKNRKPSKTVAGTGTSGIKRIEGKLPQTGSLWVWMAPWIAAAGGGMIIAGLRVRRKPR